MTQSFPPLLQLPRVSHAAGEVTLPGSKSLSNRYLLLAALADGVTRLHGLLDSDDTAVMLDSLARLGVQIERESGVTQVTGCRGRFPNEQAALFVGNSGLTIRTLVPVICAALAQSFARPPTKADAPTAANGPGVQLHGVARMHERPIADLVDGLRALGAQIDYLGVSGYPPLRLRAAPLGAQTVTVRGDTSSQFLTGLLQAAPLVATTQALRIEVQGELISKPYVGITIALMARFGVRVERSGWSSFVIPPGQFYRAPGAIAVEGDASSASYFLAAGAIGGGPVRVLGVGQDSVQGDVAFANALEQMGARITWGADWIEAQSPAGGGALQAIDLDCVAIPDAAMTLAVCALHAQGTTRLRGIGSWRVKETDRIAAMATELRKLGASVTEGQDWIEVQAPQRLQGATLATYDDHRMAMCMALACLDSSWQPGATVTILDPVCVAKTFPEFFERFAQVTIPPVLTIDGPTASGKGTVAAALAQALGWHWLDSGALYRLTALAAQDAGIAWTDTNAVAASAASLDVRFEADGTVWLNGRDVSEAIRLESISRGASQIAALPAVRAALLARQRAFRLAPGLVADGRDMGTVVFPDAQHKVFLVASVQERAARRYKQLIGKGIPVNIDDLSQDLRERDARDAMRAVAPMRPAEGALELDSTGMTIDQTVNAILRFRSGAESSR